MLGVCIGPDWERRGCDGRPDRYQVINCVFDERDSGFTTGHYVKNLKDGDCWLLNYKSSAGWSGFLLGD